MSSTSSTTANSRSTPFDLEDLSTSLTLMDLNRIVLDDHREVNLLEQIDRLIHDFMYGSNRRYPYQTRIRWAHDDGMGLTFSVCLIIRESSSST